MICCSLLMEIRTNLLEALKQPGSSWRYKIARMLNLCVKVMRTAPQDENVNPCLRVFEIFTSDTSDGGGKEDCVRYFAYLIPRGYFEAIKWLCNTRVPPILEESARPPTPMSDLLFSLILRPIQLLEGSNCQFKALVIKSVNRTIFSGDHSEQIQKFILPALAASHFPTLSWIAELDTQEQLPSVNMLYSVLRVLQPSGTCEWECCTLESILDDR